MFPYGFECNVASALCKCTLYIVQLHQLYSLSMSQPNNTSMHIFYRAFRKWYTVHTDTYTILLPILCIKEFYISSCGRICFLFYIYSFITIKWYSPYQNSIQCTHDKKKENQPHIQKIVSNKIQYKHKNYLSMRLLFKIVWLKSERVRVHDIHLIEKYEEEKIIALVTLQCSSFLLNFYYCFFSLSLSFVALFIWLIYYFIQNFVGMWPCARKSERTSEQMNGKLTVIER